ncbi:hypothetical protein ACFCV3_10965 [Kribbella sp. NPDC056345]|uniref:hypothetical protein n=1 Tax=Kribbella sp. NPDC056345 TaxID=3345789 RepID=UPI0035D724A2
MQRASGRNWVKAARTWSAATSSADDRLGDLAAAATFEVAPVLVLPGFRVILLALTAYVVAHNILYTYITDFLGYADMAGQAGWVLFTFGMTSVLSVLVVGTHIDHHLRKLVVGSTLLFAISVPALALLSGIPVLVYIAAGAWGFAFGSSPSLFIAAAAVVAGKKHAFPRSA